MAFDVPSNGGEAFAPLLNYMYTGRLEVTLDNVYSVLLATHLLHMPGALEQCRAALLRLRGPPPLPMGPASTLMSTPGSGSILRPIPNRLMIDPGICWPPATSLYPPAAPAPIGIPHLQPQLQPSVLLQSTVPLGVTVAPTCSVQETQTSARYSKAPSPAAFQVERSPKSQSSVPREAKQRSPENGKRSSGSLPFVAAAFTGFAGRAPSPTPSVSPTPSSASQSSVPSCRSKKSEQQVRDGGRRYKEELDHETGNSEAVGRVSPAIASQRRERSVEVLSVAENDRAKSSKRRGRGGESSSSGVSSVVYDVACCDGPVKFHRVLNENYSNPAQQQRVQRSCFEPENDENGRPQAARMAGDPAESGTEANTGTESYTCSYCRHTFKSQYCYRKHTKRHLLPTRLNESPGNNTQRQDVRRARREVRLLDLNVQYYPCKICGCKFPSYYFVHKHRKLCHANAEERQRAEDTNAPADDREATSITNDRK
ncbi:uncharacterized protein LOC128892829 [Hylaeus anthracinus]|uniref:uncharacterized protein LOC128892827 n=1 Tax=Hylaeus anthracinus TaxID=313031 RepID=UPI0023B9CC6D|nr:uncharacterized protein LOC128892827 [Hylaeus anthracinus]XP_054009368.1 uncharacterized protein LOC128892829 [Hylaeus anthracinus]